MNVGRMRSMQELYGVKKMQELIDTGKVWTIGGNYSRTAVEGLKVGVFVLPKYPTKDASGNEVPSRDDLRPGSAGTYLNARRFWQDEFESLEDYFNRNIHNGLFTKKQKP